MVTIAKRVWGTSLTIKEAADMMIDWCIKAREKNIIAKKPPQLIHSYIVSSTPPLNFLTPVSGIFKYSNKDIIYHDKLRDNLLRCLSVALKTHFFLFGDLKVEHEPYYFLFPSLEDSNEFEVGIVYKLEKSDKCIIVCEKDISLLYSNLKIIYDFNVALIADSFKWYHLKNWAKLKDEHLNSKPWEEDSFVKEAKLVETKEELEKYATPIDVPYYIKDYLKPLGIDWAKYIKTWFLPKGYDLESVIEYRDYLLKTIPKPVEKTEDKPAEKTEEKNKTFNRYPKKQGNYNKD